MGSALCVSLLLFGVELQWNLLDCISIYLRNTELFLELAYLFGTQQNIGVHIFGGICRTKSDLSEIICVAPCDGPAMVCLSKDDGNYGVLGVTAPKQIDIKALCTFCF